MSPDKTKLLFEAFPTLYKNKDKSCTESLMCFGFECGDGWFNLLWDLSKKLEPIAVKSGLRVDQVKEKFGGLRFYTNFYESVAEDLIDAAERKSYRTCEQCGARGTLFGNGWYYMACLDHARDAHMTWFLRILKKLKLGNIYFLLKQIRWFMTVNVKAIFKHAQVVKW